MLFQRKHAFIALANGGSSALEVTGVLAGGTQRAGVGRHMRRCTQRAGRWRVEVTGALANGAKLSGNTELDGTAQRAEWAVTQRVGERGTGCIEWVGHLDIEHSG
jgi:hypothetical protein